MIVSFRAVSLTAVLMIMATTGCSTFKTRVADSSLDYSKTTKLDPIVLPVDTQTLAFTPLYNVPQTGNNTLKLKNETGKRYELPKPISTIK